MNGQLPLIRQLHELTDIARRSNQAYLRYSRGPEADADQTSCDYESGLELPGLSAVPLTPPRWWRRPLTDWLARQVCKYAHLGEAESETFAWILTGREVDRGPDQEPLVADARPMAKLSQNLLDQAHRHYHERFEIGRDSRG